MKLIISSIFVLFSTLTFCQSSSFEKYFGPTQNSSYGHGVYQAISGSIYFGAYSTSQNSQFSFISFSKLDENGTEIFEKFIGDSINHFMLMRMVAIDDNDFILVGSKMNQGGVNAPYAIRLDSTGSVRWEFIDSSGINSWFSGVKLLPNGNIVFSGVISDTINGDINLLGEITDTNGNLLHSFIFGDVGVNETSENCTVATNGTILICGDKTINSSIVNPYVVAYDSSGNFLWDLTLDSHFNSGSKNIYLDQFGSALVIGESATDSSAQFDIQITKIDVGSATIIWSKLIPGTNFSDAGFAMSETIDGNYAIAGYGYDSSLAAKRIVLVVSDTSGNELSKFFFGHSPINIGYEICPSVYGGFLVAGADFVNDQQVLIYQKELGIGIIELPHEDIKIYPNPISINTELHFEKLVDQMTLFDVNGRHVLDEKFPKNSNSFSIPSIEPGIYILVTEIDGKEYRMQLIISE